MNNTSNEKLREAWKKDEAAAFAGWDFSYLDGRWHDTAPLPWDYRALVLAALTPETRLLDIGTGGGEFLLSLGHPPRLTSVTEAWPPNAELCRQRLAPLGIHVEQLFDESVIPYPDRSFDLVIDRHESFPPTELSRILVDKGKFITQQVGGQNDRELIEAMGLPMPYAELSLDKTVSELEAAGFRILETGECFSPMDFLDTGAVAYFCRVIAWEFPGVSVDTHFENFLAIEREIREKGRYRCSNHRFMIRAEKL